MILLSDAEEFSMHDPEKYFSILMKRQITISVMSKVCSLGRNSDMRPDFDPFALQDTVDIDFDPDAGICVLIEFLILQVRLV